MANGNCIETGMEETGQLKSFERNKYFYGKLMTVKDFETEQRCFKEKGHLLNRLIHGVGLVCGLEVSEPKLIDGKLWLKLSPGVALDCCGREIVVEGGTFEAEGSGGSFGNRYYLYLKYRECLKEPVPALSNPSACEEVCCYSRIKEDFKIEVSNEPPLAATVFDWQKVWKDRENDIKDVASKLGLPDPKDEIEAKLIITADEYFQKASCPSCDDPRVLLAVIHMTSSTTFIVDADETLAIRSVVYSNPMLHELLKSHLDDVDNPHQVTALQTEALKSVDGVENPGGDVDLVKKNAITIEPDKTNKKITIGEDHSERKDNPHGVTAQQVGAAAWATTGEFSMQITATPLEIFNVSNFQLISQSSIPIEHGLVSGLPPTVMIGLVGTNGIVMEDDLISMEPRLRLEILQGAGFKYQPLVSFKPIVSAHKTFFVAVTRAEQQTLTTGRAAALPPAKWESTQITIRWWAIPAQQILHFPAITNYVLANVAPASLSAIAAELKIPEAGLSNVVDNMMKTVSAQPEGITLSDIATSMNVKEETIKPIVDTLLESATLKSTGRGAAKKFILGQ
jgi:hypothetical protein